MGVKLIDPPPTIGAKWARSANTQPHSDNPNVFVIYEQEPLIAKTTIPKERTLFREYS